MPCIQQYSKNWTARRRGALRTGQVIRVPTAIFNGTHLALQMCPVPLAVLTYYVAGVAVLMLWMSPSMTLIVICVLAALLLPPLRARRRVFSRKRGLPRTGFGAHDGAYARSIGTADLSGGEVCVAGCAKRVGSMVDRGRWCGYASAPLSRERCRA